MTKFSGPPREISRDRFGRPLVIPPDGGKPVAYTRCTTFVSSLEDTYNLSRWQQRMVALGLAERSDLLLAVTAHRDDKDKLNKITEQATEAAKASSAATTGTALHALTERVDRGEPLGRIPDSAARDIAAYERVTEPLTINAIEQFVVLDELKIGGTTDRIVTLDGRRYCAEIKTGNVEFGIGKIAMQLAVYANSDAYHFGMSQSLRRPLDVDLERAILIHLPQGEGRCELLWVDITAGWEGVQLARDVRAWRARKNFTLPVADFDLANPMPSISAHCVYRARIGKAATTSELEAIWREASAQGVWDFELLTLCKLRKSEIQKGNAST